MQKKNFFFWVGPNPFSERPAPPHSLHTTSQDHTRGRPASYAGLWCYTCWSAFAMPYLPAFALTPCLLTLVAFPLCHHPTMCARTISSVLQGLPCRQPHHRDCIVQPMHFYFFFISIHFPVPETPVEPLTVDFAMTFLFTFYRSWAMVSVNR